jgi:hypothetical protein
MASINSVARTPTAFSVSIPKQGYLAKEKLSLVRAGKDSMGRIVLTFRKGLGVAPGSYDTQSAAVWRIQAKGSKWPLVKHLPKFGATEPQLVVEKDGHLIVTMPLALKEVVVRGKGKAKPEAEPKPDWAKAILATPKPDAPAEAPPPPPPPAAPKLSPLDIEANAFALQMSDLYKAAAQLNELCANSAGMVTLDVEDGELIVLVNVAARKPKPAPENKQEG